MAETHRFDALVEAIADGRALDWAEAEASAATPGERAAILALRDLSAIRHAYETLSGPSDEAGFRTVLPPGTSWGSLRVLEHVGRGRYGEVYRAWDPALDRHVALKLVEGPGADPASSGHVVDEGRLMARVRHPNVVTVHGAQRIGDVAGLWMEFLEGRTLAAELSERGPFDADALLTVGRQLADALAAVHDAGLVHRDVKASNVIRDRTDRVVLGDFGTGFAPGDDAATGEGLIGTPAYLAPEIFGGAPASPRSDVYSLGVLLFHLATGEYPHGAGSLGEIGAAHASGKATSVADRRPDLPRGLSEVVDRALEPDPSRRYATGRELANALHAAVNGSAATTRTRWMTAVAAVVLVAVVSAAAWSWWEGRFAFRERDWVLVTAFENRTGNPVFDGTIEHALEVELSASTFVNVVPRQRVDDALVLMRQPAGSRVYAAVGREAAVRDGGIRAVVTGQVVSLGGTYQVTAQVVDPRDGRTVVSVSEGAAGEDAVLPAVARLSARVRAGLGEAFERPPEDAPPLPRVTTRSLKALQLYDRATIDLSRDARPATAEQLLTEAVALDPEFAVAHIALARAVLEKRAFRPLVESDRAEIRGHVDRALSLTDHVSLSDRYRVLAEAERIRADLAAAEGDRARRGTHLEAAAAALDVLRRIEPDDPWPIRGLLEVHGDLNRTAEAALPLVQALVEMLPNSIDALQRAAGRSVAAGKPELARQYLGRARPLIEQPGASLEPRVFGIWYLLFEDAWTRNDIGEAAEMAERMAAFLRAAPPESPGSQAQNQNLVWIHIALGQFDAAKDAAARILPERMRPQRVGSVVWRREDPAEMRAFLDEHRIDPVSVMGGVMAPLFIAAGRLQEARDAIEALRTRPIATWQWMSPIEGQLALAEGRPDRAIEFLEPLATLDPSADLPGWMGANGLLAEALVATGRSDEAVDVLERVFEHPRRLGYPGVPGAHGWIRYREQLAQLYRASGRTAEADEIERELRLLLSFADEDHPTLRRLRPG